jgi:hypothetical protein
MRGTIVRRGVVDSVIALEVPYCCAPRNAGKVAEYGSSGRRNTLVR